MGDTLEDMDIEIELLDKTIELSEVKICLVDFKVIAEMKKLGFKNFMSFKLNGDSIMDRLNKLLNSHK